MFQIDVISIVAALALAVCSGLMAYRKEYAWAVFSGLLSAANVIAVSM